MLDDILAREHLVGSIISQDGKHTLLYAYVSPEADPIATVADIEKALRSEFTPEEYHLGGHRSSLPISSFKLRKTLIRSHLGQFS